MTRGKSAAALDLPCPPALLDPEHPLNKQDVVYETLRLAILHTWLPAASALPSSRTLAERWGIARGTVEAALDRLQAEAYVTRRAGSGTRVCAIVPERYLAATMSASSVPSAQSVQSTPSAQHATADKPLAAGDVQVLHGQPFVGRMADASLLPTAAWAKYMGKA